ncbi:MAG: 50S ribosomal protein L25 [Candidatus Eisenbacteria bacterium]|uniref:Large ribosomal subunit protein bL25 n=1 Tax=Eiseniibacteriota bacterium TaxID=2212470 RepID=A0A948RRH3_UNCEI|nr:50S ribosomal protein L25 [Candidatus Eisenbacteria bacterium]MBU1950656.1 50S ribosomal protein L25 [Candidatus Eisenbacteria bacterium]MBU2689645.1 50S ribosomal protein L25 [Candidatus Eisenbacteria bacterium]
MKSVTLDASIRSETGKGPARRMRSGGEVPAIIYGGELPLMISVSSRELESVLRRGEGSSLVVELQLKDEGGRSIQTLIKDVQRNPIHSRLVHADFQELMAGRRLQLSVPIHLTGLSIGVKDQAGVQDHVLRVLEIECLPINIPSYLEVDVSALEKGQALHVRDIVPPEGVFIRHAAEAVVVTITGQRIEEKTVAEAEAEAAAAEEAAVVEAADEGAKKEDSAS